MNVRGWAAIRHDAFVCKNIFMNIDGTLGLMPFNTKKEGLWFFDGQVWYLPKKGRP